MNILKIKVTYSLRIDFVRKSYPTLIDHFLRIKVVLFVFSQAAFFHGCLSFGSVFVVQFRYYLTFAKCVDWQVMRLGYICLYFTRPIPKILSNYRWLGFTSCILLWTDFYKLFYSLPENVFRLKKNSFPAIQLQHPKSICLGVHKLQYRITNVVL